jgi:hypothetical protein
MYRVPPAGPRWPAVGAPVDRGVRPARHRPGTPGSVKTLKEQARRAATVFREVAGPGCAQMPLAHATHAPLTPRKWTRVWHANWRGLTFELSGRRRQDARPGPVKMYRVPPARAWWPAVGAPLERGVRRHTGQMTILNSRSSIAA